MLKDQKNFPVVLRSRPSQPEQTAISLGPVRIQQSFLAENGRNLETDNWVDVDMMFCKGCTCARHQGLVPISPTGSVTLVNTHCFTTHYCSEFDSAVEALSTVAIRDVKGMP